uniref:Uncharacterized protein n=1 Tax=Rhizophora mucronata TaxID=61149 RepID=A0A2P2JBN5_RHIMU
MLHPNVSLFLFLKRVALQKNFFYFFGFPFLSFGTKECYYQ